MYRYILGDDECEWVMGNVERKTDRWERATRIEDGAVAILQFRGGARACILSQVTPTISQGAHVYGSAGMTDFGTTEVCLLSAETGGEWRVERPEGRFFKLEEQGRRLEWLKGATAQADELADGIEGRVESHRNCGENGLKALEMVHAVYESARCHEKVLLPLQTRQSPG